MMTILENKLGTRALVVNDITSQIDKFKIVTTDKGFVEGLCFNSENREKLNCEGKEKTLKENLTNIASIIQLLKL